MPHAFPATWRWKIGAFFLRHKEDECVLRAYHWILFQNKSRVQATTERFSKRFRTWSKCVLNEWWVCAMHTSRTNIVYSLPYASITEHFFHFEWHCCCHVFFLLVYIKLRQVFRWPSSMKQKKMDENAFYKEYGLVERSTFNPNFQWTIFLTVILSVKASFAKWK